MEPLLNDLEPAIHVALIAGAVVAAWIYWSGTGSSPSPEPTSIHIDSSETLSSWRPAERRVFLFVSPTCPFCDRSMDFYVRLGRVVDSMQRAGAPVALAAVIDGADSPHAQRQVFRDSNVPVDTLLSLSSPSLTPVGVTGVPTVTIHPSNGASPSTWVGLQDSTGKREILSTVRALGSSP